MEDLTRKDFEGAISLKPGCMDMDILQAVAQHALVLFHQQMMNKEEVPNRVILPSSSNSSIEKFPSKVADNDVARNPVVSRGNRLVIKKKSTGVPHKIESSDQETKISSRREKDPKGKRPMVYQEESNDGRDYRGGRLVIKKKSTVVQHKIESSDQETKISSRREKDPKGKRPVVYQEVSNDDRDYHVTKKIRNIDSDKGKKKRKVITNHTNHGPAIPPPLPKKFEYRLRQLVGSVVIDPVLVIQKGIYFTDINKGHNRLSILFSDIRNEFLNEDEIKELEKYEDNGKNVKKMGVNLIEPSLEVRLVNLKRWVLGHASASYVISTAWNDIVSSNRLVVGDVVQVWAFRVDGKLWFALVRLPRDDEGTSNANSKATTSTSGSPC